MATAVALLAPQIAFVAGIGTAGLLATLPSLWAASRLRPVAPGRPGDLFDDLGGLVPAGLRGRPWRLAVIVAGGVAALITVAGCRRRTRSTARFAASPTRWCAWSASPRWGATSGCGPLAAASPTPDRRGAHDA